MDALRAIEDWPVGAAAAGARTADAALGHVGDPARPFPLASVTKLLTAWAVHLAVEEGALALDDPAGPPGATVRHLLAHASGLAPDAPQRAADPGTRRIYSNAGYELLAAAVADATGIRFGDYLRDGVLAPLGMTATSLPGSPAHGAISTVEDLLRFAGELLAPRLLHPATAAAATAVAFPGLAGVLPGYGRQEPNDWGLGPELRGGKSPHWTGRTSSARTFGHFGRSGTFLWVDPVAGLACACLTDRPFGDWALDRWPALTDAVLAEGRVSPPPPLAPGQPVGPEEAARPAG